MATSRHNAKYSLVYYIVVVLVCKQKVACILHSPLFGSSMQVKHKHATAQGNVVDRAGWWILLFHVLWSCLIFLLHLWFSSLFFLVSIIVWSLLAFAFSLFLCIFHGFSRVSAKLLLYFLLNRCIFSVFFSLHFAQNIFSIIISSLFSLRSYRV